MDGIARPGPSGRQRGSALLLSTLQVFTLILYEFSGSAFTVLRVAHHGVPRSVIPPDVSVVKKTCGIRT